MSQRCRHHPDDVPCATKAGQDAADEVAGCQGDDQAARVATAAMKFINDRFGHGAKRMPKDE